MATGKTSNQSLVAPIFDNTDIKPPPVFGIEVTHLVFPVPFLFALAAVELAKRSRGTHQVALL
jgi:hypothetical protein